MTMERKKRLSQKAITLLNIGGAHAHGLPSNKQKLDYFQKLANRDAKAPERDTEPLGK